MADELVLLAGGGSAGHVFPGLAVCAELRTRGWSVAWVGRPRGMERSLVESQGLPYYAIPAAAVLGRGLLGKGFAMMRLATSAFRARALVGKTGACAVLGTGGFVSAPAVLGARLSGRPAVLLEPNVAAGSANRWLSRWAQAAALAHEETAATLRCRSEVTGIPVRGEFFDRQEPDRDKLRVLVLGGSQGARQLNELLPAALENLVAQTPELEVLHQVGEQWVDSTRQAYLAHGIGEARVTVTDFLEDVAAEMRRCHLVVSRAGAITLAEISAAGRAALLIPLDVAGGHQRANAQRLADTGGAEVLEGNQVETCARQLRKLLADRLRLEDMGRSLRQLARPDAAQRIADLIVEVAA